MSLFCPDCGRSLRALNEHRNARRCRPCAARRHTKLSRRRMRRWRQRQKGQP